jgi:hypothetical protein
MQHQVTGHVSSTESDTSNDRTPPSAVLAIGDPVSGRHLTRLPVIVEAQLCVQHQVTGYVCSTESYKQRIGAPGAGRASLSAVVTV